MHSFPLTITALDAVLYFGEADSITCPGKDGELTVLKNHEPLITTLREGTITVHRGQEMFEFPTKKGILEISNKGVSVLL